MNSIVQDHVLGSIVEIRRKKYQVVENSRCDSCEECAFSKEECYLINGIGYCTKEFREDKTPIIYKEVK